MGAVLVANSTRPVMHGVSVLLIGIGLGLQISKTNDKQVNANGELLPSIFASSQTTCLGSRFLFSILLFYTVCEFLRQSRILPDEA